MGSLKEPVLTFNPEDALCLELASNKCYVCKLDIYNNSNQYISFKIRSTAPYHYVVAPSTGIIPPNSSMNVKFRLVQLAKEVQAQFYCTKSIPESDFILLNTADKFKILYESLGPYDFKKKLEKTDIIKPDNEICHYLSVVLKASKTCYKLTEDSLTRKLYSNKQNIITTQNAHNLSPINNINLINTKNTPKLHESALISNLVSINDSKKSFNDLDVINKEKFIPQLCEKSPSIVDEPTNFQKGLSKENIINLNTELGMNEESENQEKSNFRSISEQDQNSFLCDNTFHIENESLSEHNKDDIVSEAQKIAADKQTNTSHYIPIGNSFSLSNGNYSGTINNTESNSLSNSRKTSPGNSSPNENNYIHYKSVDQETNSDTKYDLHSYPITNQKVNENISLDDLKRAVQELEQNKLSLKEELRKVEIQIDSLNSQLKINGGHVQKESFNQTFYNLPRLFLYALPVVFFFFICIDVLFQKNLSI